MGRPAELADRFDPQQRIATIHENAGISGESRRIAADVRDALDARLRDLLYLLFRAGAGRVEHDGVKILQFPGIERTPIEVAMLNGHVRSGPFERRGGIAGGFGGVARPRSQCESTQAAEEIGDTSSARNCLLHARGKLCFAVLGRLEEAAMRKGHRKTSQRDARRLRLVNRVRSKPAVDAQAFFSIAA